MDLNASHFTYFDNVEFLEFAFYDEDKAYGISFTRLHGDQRVELMVSDQSLYDLEKAEISFRPAEFEISLPVGTIRNEDGEDWYKVSYQIMSDEEYEKALSFLKGIIQSKSDIRLLHS